MKTILRFLIEHLVSWILVIGLLGGTLAICSLFGELPTVLVLVILLVFIGAILFFGFRLLRKINQGEAERDQHRR